MENKKPEFAFKEHSVITLVTELRIHFQDLKSYYEISKGKTLNAEKVEVDKEKIEELHGQMREIDNKISHFQVLSQALSIADTILHTESMISELRTDSKKTSQ